MTHRPHLLALAFIGSLPLSAAAETPIRLRVTSALDAARHAETVEVPAAALAPRVAAADLARVVVSDVRSGHELLAQAVDEDGDGVFDRLVFQADFAPGETKEFRLERGLARRPRIEDFRVYGRFVREREDDFAWENDVVAYRVYGPALETFVKEPLTSSAVDVWMKRTHRLVVDDWYLVDDYHRDHGEGGDFYPAGGSRGCGGDGLVVAGKLAVSRNFRESRVLASGPIRLVFELVYPLWQGGVKAEERKRVTLDAGSHFNRFESTFVLGGADDDGWAAGIRLADGVAPRVDRERGTVRTWEHLTRYGENGWLGCGLVVDPAGLVDVRQEDGNVLAVSRMARERRAVWYAGAGWDRSGDFPDVGAWDRALDAFAARLRSPLRVEVLP